MKRRRFAHCAGAAALAAVLMLSMSGCGKGAKSAFAQSGEVHVAASCAAQEILAPAADGKNAQALLPGLGPQSARPRPDALPEFLTGDQQLLYDAAYVLYEHFSMTGGFSPDMAAAPQERNGFFYYPDAGFASYEAFKAALEAVFTEEYAAALVEDSTAYLEGPEGKLYSCPGARGGRIDYQSTTFEPVHQSEEKIEFDLVGHYDDTQFAGSGYEPAGPTEERWRITLQKTDKGWRFAGFASAL